MSAFCWSSALVPSSTNRMERLWINTRPRGLHAPPGAGLPRPEAHDPDARRHAGGPPPRRGVQRADRRLRRLFRPPAGHAARRVGRRNHRRHVRPCGKLLPDGIVPRCEHLRPARRARNLPRPRRRMRLCQDALDILKARGCPPVFIGYTWLEDWYGSSARSAATTTGWAKKRSECKYDT